MCVALVRISANCFDYLVCIFCYDDVVEIMYVMAVSIVNNKIFSLIAFAINRFT